MLGKQCAIVCGKKLKTLSARLAACALRNTWETAVTPGSARRAFSWGLGVETDGMVAATETFWSAPAECAIPPRTHVLITGVSYDVLRFFYLHPVQPEIYNGYRCTGPLAVTPSPRRPRVRYIKYVLDET